MTGTVTGTGQGTLNLRAELLPEFRELFDEYGHDLTLVMGTGSTTWGTPASEGTVTQEIRGVHMPAPRRVQAANAASNLPIPAFVAYLILPDLVTDLSRPGWYLRHEGQNYYPLRDAQNAGGQGVVWVCELGSPGEVTGGDTSEPGWT